MGSKCNTTSFMEHIYQLIIFVAGVYILYQRINRAFLRTWIRRKLEGLLEQPSRRGQIQGFNRRASYSRTRRAAGTRGCSSGRASAPPTRRAAPATRGETPARGAQGSSARGHPGQLGRILSQIRYESWRCDCALCELGNTERCLTVRCARCTVKIIRRSGM